MYIKYISIQYNVLNKITPTSLGHRGNQPDITLPVYCCSSWLSLGAWKWKHVYCLFVSTPYYSLIGHIATSLFIFVSWSVIYFQFEEKTFLLWILKTNKFEFKWSTWWVVKSPVNSNCNDGKGRHVCSHTGKRFHKPEFKC